MFHDYDAHQPNASFQILLIGRRLKVPAARKNLWKKSFIPPLRKGGPLTLDTFVIEMKTLNSYSISAISKMALCGESMTVNSVLRCVRCVLFDMIVEWRT